MKYLSKEPFSSKPANKAYRDNYDKVFSRRPRPAKELFAPKHMMKDGVCLKWCTRCKWDKNRKSQYRCRL